LSARPDDLDPLERLMRRNRKLTALLDVAKALTAEHSLDNILDLILSESVKTVDADRASLFIVDRQRKELWSKIAQGLEAQAAEKDRIIRLPIGRGIAGHVAQTGRPLNIPDAYADPRFNRAFDDATGYKTQTILCVPMLGTKHEVVGVVQALNHKDGPFTEEDEELLMALGANAAAAIENANLYEDIEKLFEGFVQAAVTAIEARDPTTSGHSGRVAVYSVGCLDALPRSGGAYKELRFNDKDRRELRYASLLHDFGKVGVREHILVKAAKLFPHELELLEARFEHARRAIEVETLNLKLEALRNAAPGIDEFLAKIEADSRRRKDELDAMLDLIYRCNRPTVLEEGGFEKLRDVSLAKFTDSRGAEHALLSPLEAGNLSIARGSLNAEERREIESHVVHTYNFLKAIPWTRDLSRVPEIAQGHHEKLNGTGYPRGIPAAEIPVQTRIMTVSDIYDALTASDRPYKGAMPHARALEILESEAKRGAVDPEILAVFIEADVGRRATAEIR
jgi:HD-GYP domain-containing protein (c-di-GMP phosphodiesterase class II)